MRGVIPVSLLVLVTAGCGSGEGRQDADAEDGAEDAAVEEVVDVPEDGDAIDAPDAGCGSDEDCDDGDPCTSDVCDTGTGECEHGEVDADEDGFPAEEVDGTACGGSDCNDGSVDVYPGAIELCDAVDQDCNGDWSEAGADDDADGYLDIDCGGDDCDDTRDDVYLGAEVVCLDGVDQDCDGVEDGPSIADLRVTSAVDGSWTGKIVWTGSEFGLAWDDARWGGYEVYFTRFSAAGSIVGSEIRVTNTDTYYDSMEPGLAWTGSQYFTCWEDDRDGINHEVMCRRLGADGSLVGSEVQLTFTDEDNYNPEVAWSGSQLGVVWEDGRHGTMDWNVEIYFQRLAADGSMLGSNVRVTDDTEYSTYPAIAWSGSEFGIAFADNRLSYATNFIYFVRMSASGAKLGSEAIIQSRPGDSYRPSLVWTGSEYGVAWYDYADGDSEIAFARIAADGTKIGSDLRLTSFTWNSEDPSLVWIGGDYAVAWSDYRKADSTSFIDCDVYMKVFSADGSYMSPDRVISITDDTDSFYPTIAWSGSTIGLAWTDGMYSNREVWFNLVGACE